MFLNIEENSIFVADAHYSDKNGEFLQFLLKLQSNEIKTTQLFLMGDMFDFLSAQTTYFIKKNQKLIDIINELSSKIQIVYLEGNHDYNLHNLFNNIVVIPRNKQPITLKYNKKTVSISHGDIYTPWHYNLYCAIIRNKNFLCFLNGIDINNFISKKVNNFLVQKNICSKMKDFSAFALNRLAYYKSDMVIEGHFHQGKVYNFENRVYVNIPSLCCDKKYFILQNHKFKGVPL